MPSTATKSVQICHAVLTGMAGHGQPLIGARFRKWPCLSRAHSHIAPPLKQVWDARVSPCNGAASASLSDGVTARRRHCQALTAFIGGTEGCR